MCSRNGTQKSWKGCWRRCLSSGPCSTCSASWYSLIFLAPSDRATAFGELARIVKPGGYLVTAWKPGDGTLRRGGRSAGLGVEYDGYWLSVAEMEQRLTDVGFTTAFQGSKPSTELEAVTHHYLLARRT